MSRRSGTFVTLKLVGSVRIIIMVGPDLLVLTDTTSNSRWGASHGGAGGCVPPMNTAFCAESVATKAKGTRASRYRMANLALLTHWTPGAVRWTAKSRRDVRRERDSPC